MTSGWAVAFAPMAPFDGPPFSPPSPSASLNPVVAERKLGPMRTAVEIWSAMMCPLSAEEARDYGLVDHILERVDDIRPDVVSRAAGL